MTKVLVGLLQLKKGVRDAGEAWSCSQEKGTLEEFGGEIKEKGASH